MAGECGSGAGSSALLDMKAVLRWLVWKYGPKPKGKKAKKVPLYVNGKPRQKPLDCESDWQQLVSYEEAVAFCRANPDYRVGFALGPDGSGNCWQGLDFDGTLAGSDTLPGYVERSPSETGYHAIGYGRHFHAYTDKFEAYIRHVAEYFDLYQPERNAAQALLEAEREKIRSTDKEVSGFNVGINCGEDAGQTIFHCHIHMIPRRKGDVDDARGGIRGVIPAKRVY
jgi:hypothetical protein